MKSTTLDRVYFSPRCRARWEGDRGGRLPAAERARVEGARARVLTEWGAGKSAVKIAVELGLTKGAVTGILERSSGPAAEKAKSDHVRNAAAVRDIPRSRRCKDPERDVLILAQWGARGESATQIGNALGVTRNVVIGIVHRRRGEDAEVAKRAHGREAESAAVVAASQRAARKPPEAPKPARPNGFAAVNAERAVQRHQASPGLPPEPAQAKPLNDPFTVLQKRGALIRQPPQLALVSSVDLPPRPAEPPFDPYAHLRSNRAYHDALAALTRA